MNGMRWEQSDCAVRMAHRRARAETAKARAEAAWPGSDWHGSERLRGPVLRLEPRLRERKRSTWALSSHQWGDRTGSGALRVRDVSTCAAGGLVVGVQRR
jgi:hypothetical protein